MSARKSKEREKKKNERLHQGKILAAAKPAITPAPAPIPASAQELQQPPANLSPGVAAFLAELHRFAIDYQKLCLRASHRLMAVGLKEGSLTDAK
jgi:hypothetical protein